MRKRLESRFLLLGIRGNMRSVVRRLYQVTLSLLTIAILHGCVVDSDGYTLNNAISLSKKGKLSIVRTVAKDRRADSKGIYSFYNVEEPSGRPFVAQTRTKLQFEREYLLQGRVVPWPKGVRGAGAMELFLVEDIVNPVPIGWIAGLLATLIGGLLVYRHSPKIKRLIKHKVQPVRPPIEDETDTTFHATANFQAVAVGSTVHPTLNIEPSSPPEASPFPTFHLPYDEKSSKWDHDAQSNCTVYTFGRSAQSNNYVLNAPYIKREVHFRVIVYEDLSAFIEVNPDAKTAVTVVTQHGQALPIGANHPQLLQNECTVTIGKVAMKFRTPKI